MLFVDALLGSLLLISVVLAAPSRQGAHLAHRREGRRSRVNNRLGQTAGPVSDVEYSKNWAGAVWADGNVCDPFLACDSQSYPRPTLEGNVHFCHWYLYCPYPFWVDGVFCCCLGWYRW